MADREQPYDPYIPSGQNGGRSQGQGQGQDGNHRTAALQAVSCFLLFRDRCRASATATLPIAVSVGFREQEM